LDKVLATVWPFSRSSFKRAHQKGRVTLDGQRSANARLVKAGQIVKFWPMEGQDENIDPSVQLADCPIIYQDSSIFIINKPAGVTSHQDLAARGPFLTSFLLTIDPNLADIGDPGRPGLVHRLDKFTSGLMVVARSPEAFESLKTSFQDRLVLKKYLAFVFGAPKITGLLESNLARHPTKRHKFTVVKENGRLARSIIKVLRTFPATNVSLVEVTLLTGRTHQARLHLKQAQAPILGDAVYGVSWAKSLSQFPSLKPFLARQLLHARRLAFPHPEGGYKAFRAPWPEDFRGLWRELNRLEKNNS
jgi:23S rRNA pseudouridine1911/1915/1917 synthase